MKIHTFVVVGLLAAIGPAVHAADFDAPTSAQVSAGVGKTRAEVKAELQRAIAAHELHFGETAYPDSGPSTTPRRRIRAQSVEPSRAATPTGAPSV